MCPWHRRLLGVGDEPRRGVDLVDEPGPCPREMFDAGEVLAGTFGDALLELVLPRALRAADGRVEARLFLVDEVAERDGAPGQLLDLLFGCLGARGRVGQARDGRLRDLGPARLTQELLDIDFEGTTSEIRHRSASPLRATLLRHILKLREEVRLRVVGLDERDRHDGVHGGAIAAHVPLHQRLGFSADRRSNLCSAGGHVIRVRELEDRVAQDRCGFAPKQRAQRTVRSSYFELWG